jgi:hypothetical protein
MIVKDLEATICRDFAGVAVRRQISTSVARWKRADGMTGTGRSLTVLRSVPRIARLAILADLENES